MRHWKTGYSLFVLGFILLSCENVDHDECKPDEKSFDLKSTFLTLRDHSEQKVHYTERNGRAFIQDDIALGEIGDLQMKGLLTYGQLWTDGVVYYEYEKDFPKKDRIKNAMKEWTEVTGGRIQFVPRTHENNYLYITNAEKECWSFVGMNGGKQELNLGDDCSEAVAIHELGHALGLWHEQSRSDRDDYVKINWCYIKKDKLHNFEKEVGINVGEYDYQSIMHYTRRAFANKAFVSTIESKTGEDVPSSHPKHTSKKDRNAIICAYDESIECE